MDIKSIIEKYYSKIYNICLYRTGYNKAAAENCTNEVFILLVVKWENVSKRDVYRWLLKTTDYKLKEYFRQKKKDTVIISFENSEQELSSPTELNDEIISDEEIEKYKERILSELSDQEKALYRDYFEDKLSYKQIADKLGIKYSTAASRVSKLKSKLENEVHKILCLSGTGMIALRVFIALMERE